MFLLERAKALHTGSGAPMHLNGGSGGPPNPFGAPNNPFLGHPGFPGIRSGLFPGWRTDKEFQQSSLMISRSTAHLPSGLDGDGGQGHASEMEAVAAIDAITAHYPGVDPTIRRVKISS